MFSKVFRVIRSALTSEAFYRSYFSLYLGHEKFGFSSPEELEKVVNLNYCSHFSFFHLSFKAKKSFYESKIWRSRMIECYVSVEMEYYPVDTEQQIATMRARTNAVLGRSLIFILLGFFLN